MAIKEYQMKRGGNWIQLIEKITNYYKAEAIYWEDNLINRKCN